MCNVTHGANKGDPGGIRVAPASADGVLPRHSLYNHRGREGWMQYEMKIQELQ